MIYPWQTTQWNSLLDLKQQDRLPHALLFKGMAGTGKYDFACQFARALLCKRVDSKGQACGQCDACQLIEAGTHPDFLQLAPEEPGKAIKVDEVRSLCQEMQLTSQYGGYKLVIINHADSMNINASNSLLKTLEEPTANSILILVSSSPHRLPITIRSRCQNVMFTSPDTATALDWLQAHACQQAETLLSLAHGSPLAALELGESGDHEQRDTLVNAILASSQDKPIVGHAESLSKLHSERLLNWFYDWLTDLVNVQQGAETSRLVHIDKVKELNQLAGKITLKGLYLYMDQLNLIRRAQSIPMNTQLMWEDLLISWKQYIQR
ncbi:MAG: DNA polymerase III subunit delta' [Gammaproteobacteria bacterium]|nr:DNA polymerase III subunit delta' [Gammaproteobacteria bacterium]